jgi:ribosome maturation factor RimP
MDSAAAVERKKTPTMHPPRDALARALADLGFELVDARWHYASGRSRSGGLLRVMIDRDGGVTIADCEAASRQLSRLLAAEGARYRTLEVSSPGPNRPLNGVADFRRFAGRRAKITLRIPHGDSERTHFVGELGGVNDAGDVTLLGCDGEDLTIAADDIAAAKLAPHPAELAVPSRRAPRDGGHKNNNKKKEVRHAA